MAAKYIPDGLASLAEFHPWLLEYRKQAFRIDHSSQMTTDGFEPQNHTLAACHCQTLQSTEYNKQINVVGKNT